MTKRTKKGRERVVYHEYPDGSCIEAVVRDGVLVSCLDIRIAGPQSDSEVVGLREDVMEAMPDVRIGIGGEHERGLLSLFEAMCFFGDILEAIEETDPWTRILRSIRRQLANLIERGISIFRRAPA